MKRVLTALAASALLSATSLPAGAEDYIQSYQAEDRGLSVGPGEVLAGLVALGIIAAVLDHNDDPVPAPTQPAPSTDTYTVKPTKPKPHPHSYALPAHCLRSVSGNGQHMRLYGRHCMSEAHVYIDALPKQCRETVPVQSGKFVGYRANCLHTYGYRTAHR